MKYSTSVTKMLADTFTPVSVYLILRDIYPGAILLESADHRAADNSFSFLCFEPLAEFKLDGRKVKTNFRKQLAAEKEVNTGEELYHEFGNFLSSFNESKQSNTIANGLFGYITFDAVSV